MPVDAQHIAVKLEKAECTASLTAFIDIFDQRLVYQIMHAITFLMKVTMPVPAVAGYDLPR